VTHIHPEAMEYEAAADSLLKAAQDEFMPAMNLTIVQSVGVTRRVLAVVVPGTEGTLAVDERVRAGVSAKEPAEWFVTHVPTGLRVDVPYMSANSRECAALLAKRFYRAATDLGCDLHSRDADSMCAPIRALDRNRIRAFWEAISK
jgi:hypothetical protein